MPKKIRNKFGQAMHSKGLATRRRILDETMALLGESVAGRISTADVARACGLTPPALYLYFAGVPEIVLARLTEIREMGHPCFDILQEDYSYDRLHEQIIIFLRAFSTYWCENKVPLNYLKMMAEHGDKRFLDMRIAMAAPIREWLEKRIETGRPHGFFPADLPNIAIVDMGATIIDSSVGAAIAVSAYFDRADWEPEKFIEALGLTIFRLLSGGLNGNQLKIRENTEIHLADYQNMAIRSELLSNLIVSNNPPLPH